MYFKRLVIFCVLFMDVHSSLTTDYYSNLITERNAEAFVYQLPESNAEFQPGLDSNKTTDLGHYDFIIVGAGSSGSVLATRLTEINDWKILLLEAGGEEDDFSNIPAELMFLQLSDMNWGYYSTPQKNCCLGMKDQKCMIPRGKSIGGSSALNAVLYVRGNSQDYDQWEALGNPGWSYKDVLPYFIKSENSQIDGDPGYHGIGGFWNVEYSFPASDLYENFIAACDELNMTRLDYNGKGQIGTDKSQINIKHGKRQSLGTAFLDNARKRKNIHVITNALVTKVAIDLGSKEAQGVEFVTKEEKFSVRVDKEVILSAGAINSPQILMLSGIGPKKHLEELGIEVIADLPVGENLLDHPLFPGLVIQTNYTLPGTTMEILLEQYLNGLGPLTSPAHVDSIGFIHTGAGPADLPTVEYLFIPPGGSTLPILNRVYNYDDNLVYNFLSRINSRSDITVYLALLHQKSKGRITLQSTNPVDFPLIDLNMFAEPEDVDNLIEGIEFVINLTKTEAFKKINANLLNVPICTEFTKYSKQYWECMIRQMTQTIYHPCGTTAMGPNKTTSVVDNNLKVHGIGKLRIVDAGVFPTTISGHTNAPAVMVAEKIADAIKDEYGYGNN
ncbi:glucose dehydrogenase [FAD, quinone]-like [Tribolium madens]|uniref:glucose dehydrogenase [FAD, quinone]-like n=1 Tax=Tribolium madens TaxID=41895 RepID=UPI001CF73CEC|nr:glucose dehydrogenase [FAD, quinone]-like [Tribolium madens]